MANVQITTETIDVNRVIEAVESHGYGAIVTFSGVVRNHSRSKRVIALEYEAYLPMAEKELARIAEEAETRWGVACAITHRLGRLEVGEHSVVIAVASPHRVEAFESCRWLMDTLKENVPIWKKEFTDESAHWVEGNHAIPSK